MLLLTLTASHYLLSLGTADVIKVNEQRVKS